MEESEVKYIGNGEWRYKINGRDATEAMNQLAEERAEQRRLYENYGGTASRIIDDCKNWRDEEITIVEFKYAIMRKIDEWVQSKEDKEFLDSGIQEFKRIEYKDNVIIDGNVISKRK